MVIAEVVVVVFVVIILVMLTVVALFFYYVNRGWHSDGLSYNSCRAVFGAIWGLEKERVGDNDTFSWSPQFSWCS